MIWRHFSTLLAFLFGACASQAAPPPTIRPADCRGTKFGGEQRERRCLEIEKQREAQTGADGSADREGG